MGVPRWAVERATPREDYTILIDFADGSTRLYDARPLLSRKYFEKLNALPFFMRAHASFDTVAWDDDIDIAPEHLYENSTPVSPA